ncbi:phospholipid carrier-dependent glycosyltransferase [Candidatus Pacearchaeota archaeon]|nr:phospholipid carrier-dependent glycosyltransferase [Candidatus Pacearchaeota archaeon]
MAEFNFSRENTLLVILFIIYLAISFIIGFSHPFLLDEGLYAQFSKAVAENKLNEVVSSMGSSMGHPPLNIFINAFFIKLFGYSEFSMRILVILSVIILFPASYFLARQIGFSKIISGFFAFLLSLSFPILKLAHFAMTDVPALLFMLLSFLFFLKYEKNKNYLLLGALFCIIGFFFKQYVIATSILIPYFFIKQRKFNWQIIASCLIIAIPLFSWLLFNSHFYGSSKLVSSYIELQFNPLIMLKKFAWLLYILGFFTFPFLPFFISKKSFKYSWLLILLIPLAFISIEFLGSSANPGGYSIHGRIPLFYHILPWKIYLALCFIFFISLLLFISKLNFFRNKEIFLVLASFLIILSFSYKASGGISIVDIRHTIFLLPFILLLAFRFVKINFYFFLMSAGIIIYSALWTLALIATANSGYNASMFINQNISSAFYAMPPLLYTNNISVKNISDAEYIVTGEGFSSYNLLENCTIIKNFDSKLFGFTIAKRFICKRQ